MGSFADFLGPMPNLMHSIENDAVVKELVIRFDLWAEFAQVDPARPMFFPFETHPTHWVIFSRLPEETLLGIRTHWQAEFFPKQSMPRADWDRLVRERAREIGATLPPA